jgi:glycosyltransferase involved in cell wall biosynthesis
MSSASPADTLPRRAPRKRYRGPRIDVVVPIHNEDAVLEQSVCRLHDFLATSMPFAWRIVIVDNASTDDSWEIAQRLRAELVGVAALHLDQKGRGRALRTAWSETDADIVCYTDVDLSTDLRALLPLVAGLVSGHSDLAIGTRLAPGARIVRSRKREFISRSYNRLLRLFLRARFSDAQCGFKAVRADVARRLLPEVRDEGWFFDTELLVLAQRQGLRIHEVPVDWVEDRDSRVEIIPTALGDLRGVGRLLLQTPLSRFLAIGVLSTLAYASLYLVLRVWLGSTSANAVALALTAVANTQANRRFSFGLRGRSGLVRQHAAGALIYLLALALTDGALQVLHALVANPGRGLELIVLVVASGCATISRYLALRSWVFGRRARSPSVPRALSST